MKRAFPVPGFLLSVSGFLFLALPACTSPSTGPSRPQPPAPAPAPARAAPLIDTATSHHPTTTTTPSSRAASAPSTQSLYSVGSWLPDPDEQKKIAAESAARARAALDIGDADGAAREAQAALYTDPGSVDAAALLARAQFALGNLARAEAVARATVAIPAGEKEPTLWMILGLAAERDGRIDEALAAYDKATRLDRRHAGAWTNLGALYLQQESFALAVDAFEQAARLRPDSAAAHSNLASALRARTADFTGEADRARAAALIGRALDEYARALQLDAGYAPAVFNLALIHLDGEASGQLSRKEQLEAAIQLLEKYQDLVKQQRRGARTPAPAPADEYLSLARSLLAKAPR